MLLLHRIRLGIQGNGNFSSFRGRESTIYALATGGIRCAVAVIRVSGPETSTVLKRLGNFSKLPQPRKAVLRKLYDPELSISNTSSVIDHGIVLWFPGPSSYSGEDSCEFQVHGGPAVVTAMLKSIGTFPGCRVAEPGEFTKRAFLNGKMDLTEIDGLGDLISAETEMQRLQALNQMSGSLGKLYESWRDRIAKALANAEAYIDFGEDENIEQDILETIENEIQSVIADIKLHLGDARKGERLRDGVQVAILGKPNVGKSSLLNLLCKREAAIVSPIPGTTRDVLETTVNLCGYPVVFADTAGIREEPGDTIESEGIRRAVAQVVKADLVVLVLDSAAFDVSRSDLSEDELIKKELREIYSQDDDEDLEQLQLKLIAVFNKVDLSSSQRNAEVESSKLFNSSKISCKTSEGVTDFLEKLSRRVASLCADPKSEAVYLTQERYRSHLENCRRNLEVYLETTTTDLAIKTQSLKNAMNSIGYITGHFGTEEILDILFRDFCIGK